MPKVWEDMTCVTRCGWCWKGVRGSKRRRAAGSRGAHPSSSPAHTSPGKEKVRKPQRQTAPLHKSCSSDTEPLPRQLRTEAAGAPSQPVQPRAPPLPASSGAATKSLPCQAQPRSSWGRNVLIARNLPCPGPWQLCPLSPGFSCSPPHPGLAPLIQGRQESTAQTGPGHSARQTGWVK